VLLSYNQLEMLGLSFHATSWLHHERGAR